MILSFPKVCLKNTFCKMYVIICEDLCLNKADATSYVSRIRVNYSTKWDIQITKMIFQTSSRFLRCIYTVFLLIPRISAVLPTASFML